MSGNDLQILEIFYLLWNEKDRVDLAGGGGLDISKWYGPGRCRQIGEQFPPFRQSAPEGWSNVLCGCEDAARTVRLPPHGRRPCPWGPGGTNCEDPPGLRSPTLPAKAPEGWGNEVPGIWPTVETRAAESSALVICVTPRSPDGCYGSLNAHLLTLGRAEGTEPVTIAGFGAHSQTSAPPSANVSRLAPGGLSWFYWLLVWLTSWVRLCKNRE